MDLSPNVSSPAVVRRQLADRAESESVDSERPTDYESESADLLKSIDEYELELSNQEMPIDKQNPEQREELAKTSEREPTKSGR